MLNANDIVRLREPFGSGIIPIGSTGKVLNVTPSGVHVVLADELCIVPPSKLDVALSCRGQGEYTEYVWG